MTFSMPRVVLFDWDATLANTYDLVEEAHNHVLARLGMPPRPPGWLKPIFGMTREESYDVIYGRRDSDIDTLFVDYITAHHIDEVKPMPGAEAVLRWLREAGIPTGVVTNKRPPLVGPEIAAFGWQDYFQTVVGSGEAEADKPAAAPLLLTLQRLAYTGPIKDVWYVGDSNTDQGAAKNTGCSFIAYNDGCMPPLDHDLYQPLIEFSHYENLLGLFRSLS